MDRIIDQLPSLADTIHTYLSYTKGITHPVYHDPSHMVMSLTHHDDDPPIDSHWIRQLKTDIDTLYQDEDDIADTIRITSVKQTVPHAIQVVLQFPPSFTLRGVRHAGYLLCEHLDRCNIIQHSPEMPGRCPGMLQRVTTINRFPTGRVICRRRRSRILLLNACGVGGLGILVALRQLEHAITDRDHVALADLFDWIIGANVGGLVAIALRHGQPISFIQLVLSNALPPSLGPSIFRRLWCCRLGRRSVMSLYRPIVYCLPTNYRDMPHGTAVVVHDVTDDCDVMFDHASTHPVSNPVIHYACATMADPVAYSPVRMGNHVYNGATTDPFVLFSKKHPVAPDSIVVRIGPVGLIGGCYFLDLISYIFWLCLFIYLFMY